MTALETVHHDCRPPHGHVRGRWVCPVCRKPWQVTGSGSMSSHEAGGELIGATFRQPDGRVETFGALGSGPLLREQLGHERLVWEACTAIGLGIGVLFGYGLGVGSPDTVTPVFVIACLFGLVKLAVYGARVRGRS